MISIVMAYVNRREQLDFTLYTISQSSIKDIEVIIVNDGSNEQNAPELLNKYNLDIRIINIPKRSTINPCVVYNTGFWVARGEIIVIQNPEVCHIGDILFDIKQNLKENDYFSYECYGSPSLEKNREMELIIRTNDTSVMLYYINGLRDRIGGNGLFQTDIGGWLNHRTKHCVAYHYISAIYKTKLINLFGFDSDYEKGLCHDDDEFIRRIWRSNMSIDVRGKDSVGTLLMGIHQWHESASKAYGSVGNILWKRNNTIFREKMTQRNISPEFPIPINFLKKQHPSEKEFLKKIPKIFNCYWYGNQFSYLNYLCLETFKFHNPDWDIRLYRPKKSEHKLVTWNTNEQRVKYSGKNYYEEIQNLNVKIYDIDFEEIGFFNDASDVHKSDYLRWYLLYKDGGIWSDLDILYIKPISEIDFTKCENTCPQDEINTGIFYFDHVFPIGLLFSSPNNPLFKKLLDNSMKYYDRSEYQCMGAVMWRQLWGTKENLKKDPDLVDCKISILEKNIVYPYRWNEDTNFFYTTNMGWITPEVIGIHWYNGGVNGKKYCSENTFQESTSVVNILIKEFDLAKLDRYFLPLVGYNFYFNLSLEGECINITNPSSIRNLLIPAKDLCSSNILYDAFDTDNNVFFKGGIYITTYNKNPLLLYSGIYVKKESDLNKLFE